MSMHLCTELASGPQMSSLVHSEPRTAYLLLAHGTCEIADPEFARIICFADLPCFERGSDDVDPCARKPNVTAL